MRLRGMMKLSKGILVGFVCLVSILLGVSSIFAQNVNLSAGASYDLGLYSERNASMWAGLRITQNNISLDESSLPFLTLGISSAGFGTSTVLDTAFPGANHNDGYHYYVALQESTFNASHLRNVSLSDLEYTGMFNQSLYPQFDEEYYILSENPNTTLCCSMVNITFAGLNFSVFNITVLPNSTLYVGKYNNGTADKPIFISPITNNTCYTVGACVSQLLVPVSPYAYNMYSIHKFGAYYYDVYIDGTATTVFSRSAAPHNVSLTLRNLYGGYTVANYHVAMYEDYGNDIIMPALSGIYSESFALSTTDLQGNTSFIVIPTDYTSLPSYEIGIATYVNDTLLSLQQLTINVTTNASTTTPPFGNESSMDYAKIVLSAYTQLHDISRRQANERFEVREVNVSYDIDSDTFSYNGTPTITNFTVSAGSVHAIRVQIVNGSNLSAGLSTGYSWRIRTNNSLLLVVPDANDGTRSILEAANNQTLYVVPPFASFQPGNITLEIYNPSNTFINANNASYTGYEEGGIALRNDSLLMRLNAIGQILQTSVQSIQRDS